MFVKYIRNNMSHDLTFEYLFTRYNSSEDMSSETLEILCGVKRSPSGTAIAPMS